MPTETIVVVACVLAFFGVFAAVLAFGDMTWHPRRAAGRTE